MAKKGDKKGSKKKSSTSSSSTTNDEEIKRKELLQNAKNLKEQIENETKKKHEFETKVEQLKFYWNLEKQELENRTTEYERIEADQRRLKQDHERRIESIKERIKKTLYQNQNHLIKAKNESKVELYQSKEENSIDLRKKELNTMECQHHLRNMQIAHNNLLHQLRHDHDTSMKRLQDEFKLKFNDITVDAEQKVKEMKEEVEVEMKGKFSVIEEKKDQLVKDLLCQHEEV